MLALILNPGKTDRNRLLACLVLLGLAAAAGLLALYGLGPAKTGRTVRVPLGAAAAAELARLPARPADIASQQLEPLDVDTARKLNAETPFAEIHPEPARPFRFAGSALDRSRAVECLALAAMAEAGGSDPGQRAVIQVVLNRVRHPAFAKSVCGVVFEGSERTTGCQFSFTCDGSLARHYSDAAWAASRRRANEALDGKIFAAVGAATHYHTDWVHPVWSGQLSKIAQVETHLFFRWPGYWGSRDAGRVPYSGGEPAIAKLGQIDAEAATATASDAPPVGEPVSGPAVGARVGIGEIAARHAEGGAYLVHLDKGPVSAAAISVGRRLCGGRGYCRVLGWIDRKAIPAGFPVPPAARAKLSFSYVLDATNDEYIYYDCKVFQDVPRDSCLPPASQ